jgi:hypothetical protein
MLDQLLVLRQLLQQRKTFEGHAGRKGKVGGSSPRGQSSDSAFDKFQTEPLIRIIGKDFSPVFFHGTKKSNIRHLADQVRPVSSVKKATSSYTKLFGAESNEFGAEMFLSEPRQPQQAVQFAKGEKDGLAVVILKQGTKILDLSDELTRHPSFTSTGDTPYLRFFRRPAITNDFIAWRASTIGEGYKQRHPNWLEELRNAMDPSSAVFGTEYGVDYWKDNLVGYAKEKGFGAIRLADEILLVDRSVIESARKAKYHEVKQAILNSKNRTYPGGKRYGLYTDQPTSAYREAWN